MIAKRVLQERYAEGISELYLHLQEKGILPPKPYSYVYWFFVNLNKRRGKLNFDSDFLLNYQVDVDGSSPPSYDPGMEWDLALDLKDPVLIDFLLNNHNNQKWTQIYRIIYDKQIELNLFESIMFEYVFLQGLSIREIQKITGNSFSWVYQYRKSLIEKIKKSLP